MQTAYDWIAVLLFALIAVVYLQRSTGKAPIHDPVWRYLPPVAGCVLGNWLGNEGHGLFAGIVLIAALAYTVMVLKPFRQL